MRAIPGMDENRQRLIRQCVERWGGKDALSEDEKKTLVGLAKKDQPALTDS